ncbi:MAG: hypothetical protein LBL79_13250, partial [Prevotella sp.]|nr:hypothetical protein [Prevotella sp.]
MMATGSKNNNTTILIGVIALLLVAIGVAAYFIFNQKAQIQELQEVSLLNKQELEDEYGQLSYEYEKVKMNLKNDSLLQKLTSEQTKVQRLLEELKTVKAENKSEIARLNKELSALRQVLRSYVMQIDSLNRANTQLRQEKKEITDKYQETARTLNQVSQQKQDLSEKVTLAAKL